MNNIWLIIKFTFREALARKVFLFFLIITVSIIIGLIVLSSLIDTDSILSFVNSSLQKEEFAEAVLLILRIIIAPLSALCLFLSIFASASFIPVMLEKGNIDLLLSKPISRTQLLIGKYLGGLFVVFVNITFLIASVWIIISFKLDYWSLSLLWPIFTVTLTFAVLNSLMVLLGVITKNSTLGMMVAYFIYLILSPLFHFFHYNNSYIGSKALRLAVDIFYYIIPQTTELMENVTKNLSAGNTSGDYMSVLTSILFIALMLGISLKIFARKDF